MPRHVRELSNIEIDEVSLVDRPANQHARVAIAKRATEEENVPEIFSEDGQLLDESQLTHGDVVYDAEGNAYMFVDDEDGAESKAEEREPELAGVSKAADLFGQKNESKSLADKVREDLSKALTEADRDAVISKAMEEVSKAEERAREAEKIAKAERELRLTRDYISKAATYNLPVEAEELGPVLMRMAETMSFDDCAVIAKALDAASEALTYLSGELGYEGGGDNNEVISQVDAFLNESIAKSDSKVSKSEAMETFFLDNPRAYDEYLATKNLR